MLKLLTKAIESVWQRKIGAAILVSVFLPGMSASAVIRYVNVNSANPASPYINWTTAATTIQNAVDAAVAGDQILVTNGVYQTGGRAVYGTMTNRVAVDKPITVQSVNGAEVTMIRGFQVPGTITGDSAVRCVYLTNGAVLIGFYLTNGATHNHGDPLRDGMGGGLWCESADAVVSNCTLGGNLGGYAGGGASGGTLNNCVLTGNWAGAGGGAAGGTLNNCTLIANSTSLLDGSGGGAYRSTLNNCALLRNLSTYGGGACLSTLNNCTLNSNSADTGGWQVGGGAADSALNNCSLIGNSSGYGGGVSYCALNNCTLSGNSAIEGGGADGGTLNNCIVYYNVAERGDNYFHGTYSHSCTTPLPPDGVGNITAEPLLTDGTHLSAGSPCRGAGSASFATGLDIDGENWASPPSIGCDEYYTGAVSGLLSVSIQPAYTNVTVGFAVNFTAVTGGHATASRWEFGDGTVVSNRPYAAHGWAAAGAYLVVFRAYNDANPGGVSATVTVQAVAQPIYYVAQDSTNPVAPYVSWATAATSIQDAVDASAAGAVVLVTNGVYQTGERVISGTTNRLAVTKAISVSSVNGVRGTVINGRGAVRCVYLSNGASLAGFTLTNGAAYDDDFSGGGVTCAATGGMVSNCVLTGNSSGYGGGAAGGTLNNCTFTSNSAYDGGGAYAATLNNCVLSGNSSGIGGAACFGILNNCMLGTNSARQVMPEGHAAAG
jgi:hypothetical protein